MPEHAATTITRAGTGDLAALVPLFDAYRVFYRQPSSLARAADFLQNRLQRDESVVFIARVSGSPAGFTQLFPTFSSVALHNQWILNDLYVSPEFRRRGLGRALLERAAAHARETGARRLLLETARDNVAAQRLYERLGWKRDEAFVSYGLDV